MLFTTKHRPIDISLLGPRLFDVVLRFARVAPVCLLFRVLRVSSLSLFCVSLPLSSLFLILPPFLTFSCVSHSSSPRMSFLFTLCDKVVKNPRERVHVVKSAHNWTNLPGTSPEKQSSVLLYPSSPSSLPLLLFLNFPFLSFSSPLSLIILF